MEDLSGTSRIKEMKERKNDRKINESAQSVNQVLKYSS